MLKIIFITGLLTSGVVAADSYEVTVEPIDCRVSLTVRPGSSDKAESIQISGISENTTKDVTAVVSKFEKGGFSINLMVFADKPGARFKVKYFRNKTLISESSYSDFPSSGGYVGGWKTTIQLVCIK